MLSQSVGWSGDPATLSFDLNECAAFFSDGSLTDYSEFTADIQNTDQINLSVVGGNLFRVRPSTNRHSCTPSFDGTAAICVDYDESSCTFNPGNDSALRFGITVSPQGNQPVTLSNLNYFDLAPRTFEWIDGATGPNNPPTLSAVRVLVNGLVIFQNSGIPTTDVWTERSFDFSQNAAFTVTEETVFDFEISAYCAAGLTASQHIWDLDNISVTAVCDDVPVDCTANGGVLSGGPFVFDSVGDGIADNIPAGAITRTDNQGQNMQWIVTDDEGYILGLPPMPSAVNFDPPGPGTCLIWSLAFDGEVTGVAPGLNIDGIDGDCYSLSVNPVEVIRSSADGCNANGGDLFGGPFTFDSVSDGIPDNIPAGAITLANTNGANMQWIVTDDSGNILGLPPMPSAVNFDVAGPGTCFIYNLAFEGSVSGLAVGSNVDDITGDCFSFSVNRIVVNRFSADMGMDTMTMGMDTMSMTMDMDGDGVPNDVDCAPADPSITTSPGQACDDGNGDTFNDVLDANCNCVGEAALDFDSDGIPDFRDNCPITANPDQADSDGDGLGDACDSMTDTDGDGIEDSVDCAPSDASIAVVIGQACDDGNPDTFSEVIDANCNCVGETPLDFDSDGIPDFRDNCPITANPDQADGDGDGLGDVCDDITDSDGDGVANDVDCDPADPSVTSSPGQACDDGNGDTFNDALDANCNCVGEAASDFDSDGIPDFRDNCPITANPGQADVDGDGLGDACDDVNNNDLDEDGVLDDVDCDPADPSVTSSPGQACDDGNGDTFNDALDANCNCVGEAALDFDSDGIPDFRDNCPITANPDQADVDGDGLGDACDDVNNNDQDGDGVPDDVDCDPMDASVTSSPGQACDDGNGDTFNDALDANCNCVGEAASDFDNDGIPDFRDNCPTTANGDQADADGNGIGDACDEMGMDTMTMGMDTMTMGMDTMTMGMDTMTMGMDTMTMTDVTPRTEDCIEGNQFAFVTDNNPDDTGELRFSFDEAVPAGRMIATIRKDFGEDAFINLSGSSTSRRNALIDIRVNDDSYEFTESGDGVSTNFPPYTAGNFATIDLAWDATNGGAPTITVVIDGQQVADPFASAGQDLDAIVDGLRTVQFRYAGSSAVASGEGLLVDDLIIFDASGAVLFSDDFESRDVGESLEPMAADSTYHPNSSDVTVEAESCSGDSGSSSEDCMEGNQFGFVTDVNPDDTGELRFSLPDSLPSGRMVAIVRKDVSGEDAFVNISGSSTSRRNAIIDIRLNDGNGYSFTESGEAFNDDANFPAFSPGEFVEFDLRWEAMSDSTILVTVIIDGQQVLDAFPSQGEDPNAIADGLRTVQFRFAGNSATDAPDVGVFVDEFTIWDASGAVVFSDDFESYDVGMSLNPDENPDSPYHPNTSDSRVEVENCGTTDPRPDDIQQSNTQPTLNFALAPTVTDGSLRAVSYTHLTLPTTPYV